MAREKYSLYDIVVKRGISRKMQRKLKREINDRKALKRKRELEQIEPSKENYETI